MTNEDGSVNSAANPAARGSVVALYGTGLGLGTQTVSVQISGILADVLYAGPVDAYPGAFQVNARVPAGYLGAGTVSVSVSAGPSE